MDKQNEMMEAYELRLDGYDTFVVCETFQELTEMIQTEVEDGLSPEFDDTITLHVKKRLMTRAEYDELQEFDGWN